MKHRRIVVQSHAGPTIVALPVDPELRDGEVEIQFSDPQSRSVTRRIDEVDLEILLGQCRPAPEGCR